MINGDFINNVFIKTPLQLWLYSIISNKYKIKDNSIIISGPDIIRHINDARLTFGKNINHHIKIVELDKDVYKAQNKKLKSLINSKKPVPMWIGESLELDSEELLPIYHNVELINDNIINIEPERVIDADLMGCSRSATGLALLSIFNDQCTKFQETENNNKAFIFTCSLRNCSEETTINWLKNQLLIRIGTQIEFNTDTSGKYFKTTLTKLSKTKTSKTGTNRNSLKLYCRSAYSIIKIGRLIDLVIYTYLDSKGPMITGLIIYK